jgi:hypothetical protein
MPVDPAIVSPVAAQRVKVGADILLVVGLIFLPA